jgi:hypothetical protein
LPPDQGVFDSIFTHMRIGYNIHATALNENCRTNEEIAAWPRIRFYDGDYQAMQPGRRLDLILADGRPSDWPTGLPWSDAYLALLDPSRPIVVVTYPERLYTLSNPFEAVTAAALCMLYRHALGTDDWQDFWNERLGVVTPHRAQMASIRNRLTGLAGFPLAPIPVVDTVDRIQGQERDCIIASYTVAVKDFGAQEDQFILSARRFNVTLTRARAKFILLISEALLRYLPSDADVAADAAHLQRFVEAYCTPVGNLVGLPATSSILVMSKLRSPNIQGP